MSRIVNTSSPRHERSRGHATRLGRGISVSNSRMEEGIRVCPNIDVACRQYPRQTFDRSSWDLRNPAIAWTDRFHIYIMSSAAFSDLVR